MSDHARIERQVARMHRVIAGRLRSGDLSAIDRAHANLARWRARFGGALPPAYEAWVVLLDEGMDAVLRTLEGEDEASIRLRSSSPFAGVLTPQERWEILRDAA